MTNYLPVIAGVEVTTDEAGRFNLNALHKAHEAEQGESLPNKAPAQWLRTSGAQDFVSELENQTVQNCIVSKPGRNGGTFAHELAAVEYAGWISPAFRIKVNQTFINYRTGKLVDRQQPSIPNFANPAEAARAWAIEYEAKQAAQQALAEATPKIIFHDQVTQDADILLDMDQVFSLLKRRTGQTFTRKTFLEFLRRHGIAKKPNLYANIGRDRLTPRKDFIGAWFESELTPTKGVEWKLRPIAVSEIVRLIEKERTGVAMVAGYLTTSV